MLTKQEGTQSFNHDSVIQAICTLLFSNTLCNSSTFCTILRALVTRIFGKYFTLSTARVLLFVALTWTQLSALSQVDCGCILPPPAAIAPDVLKGAASGRRDEGHATVELTLPLGSTMAVAADVCGSVADLRAGWFRRR